MPDFLHETVTFRRFVPFFTKLFFSENERIPV